ncbi:MAG: serine/threonine-protein kinase [Thermoanaerobaculia bacterium]|nr:serine/threonine-protein kinase [Thermoanaerobaculia bacterium]
MAEAGPGDLSRTYPASWSLTERWPEVKELLASVLEIPAAERAAFLRQCPQETLRAEVESLLSFEGGTSIDPGRTTTSADGSSTIEGERIGPYRILRPIGRGGMGEVYLATREVDFRQPVAIKLLRSSSQRDVDVDRFHRERQLLADLDHPGIARLVDGGTTDQGVPYMVMEWIDGEPLDRAADSRNLGLRQRVELFVEVCDAIGFAHRSLVIHRDLKPENILLPATGGPKLLDFGIARLLEPGGVASDTRPGPQPLTPRYASPEQWAGRPLTTATDVYSAGMVLAELLVGPLVTERRPALPSDSRELLENRLRGEDLTKSEWTALATQRGTQPSELLATVRGDLEAVLLRALAPAPEDRYSGIESFAEDLKLWLDGFPVGARKAGLAHRAVKLMQRRPWTTFFSVLAGAMILALSIVSQWQSRQLVIEAAEAEQRADEAWHARMRSEEMNTMIVDLFDLDELSRRGLAPQQARLVLDAGLERATSQFASNAAAASRVRSLFASSYRSLGYLSEAEDLYFEALEMMPFDVTEYDKAKVLSDLGQTQIRLGFFESAAATFRNAEMVAVGDPWPRTGFRAELLFGWACALAYQQGRADLPARTAAVQLSRERSFDEICQETLSSSIRQLENELVSEQRSRAAEPRHVLRTNSSLFELYFSLGWLHDAKRVASTSLRLVENSRGDDRLEAEPALIRMARVKLFLGEAEPALDLLERAGKRSQTPGFGIPNYSKSREALRALVLFALHREAEAIDDLRRLVRDEQDGDGDASDIEALIALLLAGQGNCAEATSLAGPLVNPPAIEPSYSPASPRALLAMAYCALFGGDPQEAQGYLDRFERSYSWKYVPDSLSFLTDLRSLRAVESTPISD